MYLLAKDFCYTTLAHRGFPVPPISPVSWWTASLMEHRLDGHPHRSEVVVFLFRGREPLRSFAFN